VTSNLDSTNWNPHEARLVFAGVPPTLGLTRHLRTDRPGLLEFRFGTNDAPFVPATNEWALAGPVDAVVTAEVAMTQQWGNTNDLIVDLVLRDTNGVEVASDRARLLKPIILAVGDSVTYGFMRSSGGTYYTPRGFYWAPTNWSRYISDAEWLALDPPWNNPSNKFLINFQGWRGYLESDLPGFQWIGTNTAGHGPAHHGYAGGKILEIMTKGPASVIQTSGYVIVIYMAGYNDVVAGNSGSTCASRWNTAFNDLVAKRNGRGKTLFIKVALAQLGANYSSSQRSALSTMNDTVVAKTVTNLHMKARSADAEGVPHDSGDDGLHFLSGGHRAIRDVLLNAVKQGLAQ
jgi:hypothetical protein